MVGQHLVKGVVDRERLLRALAARGPACIGFDNAERRRIELVSMLEALAGFALFAG
jgi:hypothetical protein